MTDIIQIQELEYDEFCDMLSQLLIEHGQL